VALPFTPVSPLLGLTAVPFAFVAAMSLIVGLYLVAAEAAKHLFCARSVRL
jgi:hypothetical protein